MSEVFMNHANCKIILERNLFKATTKCVDLATFERMENTYVLQFGRKNVSANRDNLEVVVQTKTADEFFQLMMVLEMAKKILMVSDPEKMRDV